ncbi:MAG: hypothetical protein ABJG78_15430 [Cyclobacteriaceae bacterium]
MRSTTILIVLFLLCISCSDKKEQIIREKVEDYFSAWNNQAFESAAFAQFKTDTSYTWHGEKEGPGIRSIFNPNSGWKQWDKAWNGHYTYDSIVVNIEEKKVTGRFNETTDFLKEIGLSAGFSAIVTFWFDENYRVKETLYEWNPDNQSMHQRIKPLVEWAKVNDSSTINRIYLKDGFKPSTKNANDWKHLLRVYSKSGGKFTN